MKAILSLWAVVSLLSGAALAGPTVSGVAMTQAADGTVTVTYDLADGPAVVTFDVLTNGVSIGGEHLVRARGDVNRVVSGTSGSFTFYPGEAWQETSVGRGPFDARAEVKAWPLSSPPDYMVVDLAFVKSDAVSPIFYYPNAAQVPGGVGNALYKTTRILMRKIPAAGVQWRMGSPRGEVGRNLNPDWNPQREVPHYVTLTSDYYIGVYELTESQYFHFAYDFDTTKTRQPANPTFPFANLSYAQIRGVWDSVWPGGGHNVPGYCPIAKLRARSGVQFDLPTEAQWEFACRAGHGSALPDGTELQPHGTANPEWGGTSDNLDRQAWYAENSGGKTHEVGLKEPNAFGLYDMLGNVGEICLDGYADANGSWPYQVEVTDPVGEPGTSSESSRVYRGGSYEDVCQSCRCAARFSVIYNDASAARGFRLVCPVAVPD